MERRGQFSTLDLLRATVWCAIACFVLRIAYIHRDFRLEQVLSIGAVLVLVISPFAAVGAMFDRMGTGILCGLAVMVGVVLFSVGAG